MKKTIAFIIITFFISGCSGDNLINKEFLSKNFDESTKTLDLSNLGLTKIPDFDSMGSGTVFGADLIDFSGNKLTEFELSSLDKFSNLRELSLANNEIKIARNLDVDMDLLDLSGNNIEVLNFSSGSTLKELNLSSNNLRFGADIGSIPSSVSFLHLADNSLQNLDGFSALKALKYLDLSNNNLSDLDMKELAGKELLKYLDISENSEMSKERIEAMEKYNKKYLDALNEKAGNNTALTGSQDQ